MTTGRKLSLIAGLLYTGVVLTGIFSLMYVPGALIKDDAPSLTFQNLTQSGWLFRLGIAGGLVCYILFLFLPLVLYRLLQPVNKNLALLMVLLALMSVPVYFINAQNQLTALSLLNTPANPDVYMASQIQSQVLFYLHQYDEGMRLVHIFSGLWLFPFGWLVFKSGFLPRALGILLMAGCFGYLVNFFCRLLIPGYPALGVASYISLPASIGEIGTCLWLLLVGPRHSSTNNKS